MSEFTLKDITDAMHSGRKITNKNQKYEKYIYFDKGYWFNQDEDLADNFFFAKPKDWSYYEEPKKTEAYTFYQFETYNKEKNTIHIRPGFWSIEKTPIPMLENEVLTKIYEKEFEVPVEEVE